MGNCNSTRCGREGEVIEPVQRSTSWSGGHQTGQKATKFGETTIEDRPINEQVVIYNENEINDRIARLEELKIERFVHLFTEKTLQRNRIDKKSFFLGQTGL